MSDKFEAAIKAVVDAAPPLTQEQRARLRALLSTPTPRDRKAGAS
jgi:hypothetical protein